MKNNEFRNKIYKAIIGEVEQREHKGTYRGNGHHLAQKLTELIDAEFKGATITDVPAADERRDTILSTLHDLRRDIADMNTFLLGIDAHIQWLGAALPKESVDIPEFNAVLQTLDKMDEKLKRAGCDIAGAN